MSLFNARLRLSGRSKLPMGVEVDIDHERMTLTAADRTVGVWPLEKLEVSSRADGFHITVDGEEIVLTVTDSKKFAAELGVEQRPRRAAAPKPVPRREVQSPSVDTKSASRANGAVKPPAPVASTKIEPGPSDDVQGRISEIAEALKTDTMSPAEAFAEWLKLMKELNHLHGEGAMPSELFHQLNTQLLDLLPDPVPNPV
ncbi:MAG TPA: hypothetical protein VI193_08885 [Acidimicrobiia bacterium]